MQTKKRAKPVKFGKKEKSAPKESLAAEKVKHTADLKQTVEVESSKKPVGKGEDVDVVAESLPLSVEKSDTTEEVATSSEESNELTDTGLSEIEHDETVESKEDEESKLILEDKVDSGLQENPVEKEKQPQEDENSDFFSVPPEMQKKKKSMLPYFLKVAVSTFLIGLILLGGVYYVVSIKGLKLSLPTNMKPAITQAQPTNPPTPTPIDLSAYTISVLNGTSTAGAAAKLKSQLTDAGFKVGSTGNADKADFTKTEIVATEKVNKAYLVKLKEILQKSYVVDSVSNLASGSSDVVVTIGSSSAK